MKITELLENKKEISKGAKASIPGLTSWKDLDNNNNPYLSLRFGMLCAGSPDFENSTHTAGPVGGRMFTINYSKADEEILNAAGKQMGVKGKRISPNTSSEKDDVHKMSPVSNWNKTAKVTKATKSNPF